MSDWDAAAAMMDEAVDLHLSDTISYSTDAGVTFLSVPGYLIPYAEGLGLNGIDDHLGSRWRMKVAKTLVPDPHPSHQIQHPRLGADTWKPANRTVDDQGRYWIFDIQRIAT